MISFDSGHSIVLSLRVFFSLETLVDQWEQFEGNAATLQTWLATAENKLKLLGGLDDADSRNIGSLNQKMQIFLVSHCCKILLGIIFYNYVFYFPTYVLLLSMRYEANKFIQIMVNFIK